MRLEHFLSLSDSLLAQFPLKIPYTFASRAFLQNSSYDTGLQNLGPITSRTNDGQESVTKWHLNVNSAVRSNNKGQNAPQRADTISKTGCKVLIKSRVRIKNFTICIIGSVTAHLNCSRLACTLHSRMRSCWDQCSFILVESKPSTTEHPPNSLV